MAVPKRKMSRSNTRARRSQWKATPAALSTCPQCKAPRLPHQACPSCGAYNQRSYAEAIRTDA
ncbi:50S ribosomal protein L32 [Salana multivorans]